MPMFCELTPAGVFAFPIVMVEPLVIEDEAGSSHKDGTVVLLIP